MARKKGKKGKKGKGVRGPGRKNKRMHLQDVHRLAKVLSLVEPGELTTILKCLNTEGRRCLYSCVYNVIYNKSIASKFKRKEMKAKLKPHAKDLKYLADESKSDARRKTRLVQKGGQLIPIILTCKFKNSFFLCMS